MKYIFLIALSLAVQVASAATVNTGLGQSPTPTNTGSTGGGWSSSGAMFDNGGDRAESGLWTPSGAAQDSSGGGINTTIDSSSWTPSSAAFDTSGGGIKTGSDSSGGSIKTLAPLAKPDLSVSGFVLWFVALLNYVAIAILGLALLCFLYGIFVLMFVGGANEESRSKGKKFMFWGIISLFVMVSVWGLVNVLKVSIFGEGSLILPQLK
ncbi:MAG: hypothetical protein V4576_01955 [Patescibacteria group bacterium]